MSKKIKIGKGVKFYTLFQKCGRINRKPNQEVLKKYFSLNTETFFFICEN
jgi:hypothetical protein